MAPIELLHVSNPLLTSSQLIDFQSYSTAEARSVHFAQYLLTQSAGILLRLPQEVIAKSIVLLQRHLIVSSHQKPRTDGQEHPPKTLSAAAIYLAAKLSLTPVSPRSIINVYAYLTNPTASPLWFINPTAGDNAASTTNVEPRAEEYYVSEGTHEREKVRLFAAETEVLASIGFDTDVFLPHQLALTYLQALGASSASSSVELACRVFEHLNGGLTSPQLLYLTHQPNALAVAAIYLAAREVGVKLVEENWWEVFDVDREDLGFLVLAFGSLTGFAEAEREKWKGRSVPLLNW